jgi:AmmeMemoRadiSam system protein B
VKEKNIKIQKADYSGLYYPSDKDILNEALESALGKAYILGPDLSQLRVTALIVPSTGFSYSATIASSAYRELIGRKYQKVIVIGPSHYIVFPGMALSESDYFESPMGLTTVDQEVNSQLAMDFNFVVKETAFMKEYSIELQLPFLQKYIPEAKLIPLVLGNKINYTDIAVKLGEILDNNTLLIVSTNLSHFLSNEKSRKVDQETINALLAKDTNAILENGQASALSGLAILTEIAKAKEWQPMFLAYANSSEAGDDASSVVGYCSLVYISE